MSVEDNRNKPENSTSGLARFFSAIARILHPPVKKYLPTKPTPLTEKELNERIINAFDEKDVIRH